MPEQVAANISVPASPLVSSMPTVDLQSMVELGRSYLQNRDVSYLGHAIRMSRPLGGKTCAKFGLAGYDQMIETDPTVSQGIDILYMAATANEVKFGANDSPGRDIDKAQGAANFLSLIWDQLKGDPEGARAQLTDSLLRYGNGFLEIEYGPGKTERLQNYLVATDVHHVAVENVVIITDTYNRIIGYAPYGFPGVTAPLDSFVPVESYSSFLMDTLPTEQARNAAIADTKILPPWKVIFARWRAIAGEVRGASLLEPAFQPWWAKQQMMSVLLMLVEQWGLPRKTGRVSERTDSVCIYDASGNPIINPSTGLPVQVDALPAMLKVLDNSASGGSIALPYGYDVNLLESDPEWAVAIIRALDFFNIEISRAILKQHLASGEGARGSEKGATAHGDILSMMILHAKKIVAKALRLQFARPLMQANFGTSGSSEYLPTIDIGDADGMPLTLSEVGFLMQSNYFAPDQLPAIDRRIGVPVRELGSQIAPQRGVSVSPQSAAAANEQGRLTQAIKARIK